MPQPPRHLPGRPLYDMEARDYFPQSQGEQLQRPGSHGQEQAHWHVPDVFKLDLRVFGCLRFVFILPIFFGSQCGSGIVARKFTDRSPELTDQPQIHYT